MPNTTRKNPDANFNSVQRVIKGTGQLGRASKTQTDRLGRPVQVPEQIDYRFKKKRLGGKRAAARSRSALAIPLDSERPIPRF